MSTSSKKNPTRNAAEPTLSLPGSWIVALAVLVIAPWLVVAAIYLWSVSPAGPRGPGAVADGGSVTEGSRGPWGDLTLLPIVISPPLELVTVDWGPIRPPMWMLPGVTAGEASEVLRAVGVPPGEADRVVATARPDPRISGVVLTPDPAWVRRLTPDVRARLYMMLAKASVNHDQAQSFRYLGPSAESWLGTSLISPETRQLVEPLLYRDGDYLHFADVELIRSEIRDDEQLRRLAKGLLRQPTYIVKLAVGSAEAVDGLAAYWGRGGRRTDVRPLLESVAGAGPDRSIDIVHLLPAFARNYLYRYPKLSAADFDRPVLANCLWTSLNFFGTHPDDRFLDVSTALDSLKRDYYVVESGFELGDIIALLDSDGTIFHAAVYLADGLVFTKNGTSPMAPWTIMSIDGLKGYYRTWTDSPRLIYHRRNDL